MEINLIKEIFRKIAPVAIAAVSLISATANAANITCFSKVALIGVGNAGDLIVKLADANGMVADAHYICNISTQGSYVTTPEACKSTLAVLTAARQTASVVYIDYTTTPAVASCQAIPAWSYQYGARAVRF